jgi:hypothetical protein
MMSPMTRARLFVVLTVLAGCATTAESLPSNRPALAPTEALLVGELGVRDWKDVPPSGRDLSLRRLSDDSEWKVVFLDELRRDDLSAPFFAILPPGTYQIADWRVSMGSGDVRGDATSLGSFELGGGQVSCVGSLLPLTMTLAGFAFRSLGAYDGDCQAIIAILKTRAPGLQISPAARLAFQPERAVPTSADTSRFTVSDAAALMLASSRPANWSAGDSGALLVPARICVDQAGRVESVKVASVVERRSEDLMKAVASEWRFRPLFLGGRPVGVCHEHMIPRRN